MRTPPIPLEQLKKSLSFKESQVGDNTILVTATFQVHATLSMDRIAMYNDELAKVKCFEHLTEIILRRLYDYDTSELCEAISNLKLARPFDYSEMDKAIEQVFLAARRQLPK